MEIFFDAAGPGLRRRAGLRRSDREEAVPGPALTPLSELPLMIEIPSDLHPDLVPLAFLLGDWEGAGVHDFPGSEKCNFGQEVTFSHDGRDFLEYHSHTWVLDNDGNKVRPLESESRLLADRPPTARSR